MHLRWSGLFFEWLLLALVLPVLTFPTRFPSVTIAALGIAVPLLVVLAWRHGTGLRASSGPLYLPALLLTVFLIAGSVISPEPELMLPKAAACVFGLLVFRGVVLTATNSARLVAVATAYVMAGTAMAAGALLAGPRWIGKFPSLNPIYSIESKIPRVLLGLPGAESGVNSTALGGATLYVVPFAAVLLLFALRAARSNWRLPRARGVALALALVSGLALAASGLVLLLSQARGAYIAAALVAVLVPSFRYRRGLTVTAAIVAGCVIAWAALGRFDIAAVVGPERPFIWRLAADEWRAHPITGTGLGAFRMMSGPAPDAGIMERIPVYHAHNIFLQVALDVGLLGLVAYLGLLVQATRMTRRVLDSTDDLLRRGACLAGWSSLLGVHLFGLADALALGTKVGVFFWWNLALIAATYVQVRSQAPDPGLRA